MELTKQQRSAILTDSTAWKSLQRHHQQLSKHKLTQLFQQNPQRFEQFSIVTDDFLVDFSKNLITRDSIELLLNLAKSRNLALYIERLFHENQLNHTEQRAVLHTRLRNPDKYPEVCTNLAAMQTFIHKLQSADIRSVTDEAFTDVLCIGMGGSDLGARLTLQALSGYQDNNIRLHFLHTADSAWLQHTLAKLTPNRTFVMVASKSFTTEEVFCNLSTVKSWLRQSLPNEQVINKHIAAITAKPQGAREQDIHEFIFTIDEGIGGRFSIWSAMGLPLALSIGIEQFKQFLAGAYAIDQHFQTAEWSENIPVILALIGIWQINFFQRHNRAILPYCEALQLLPAYLQQLHMESNGKRVNQHGEALNYHTGPIIWGGTGTCGQHAYHQLLHQGTEIIPIDFILPIQQQHSLSEHNRLMMSHCLAQSQALLQGYQPTDDALANHKLTLGNRPSNTILINTLSPYTLGKLLAIYEHKVFVQGVIWGINSFDQWGVELGKRLAKQIQQMDEDPWTAIELDSSTLGLYHYIKEQQS